MTSPTGRRVEDAFAAVAERQPDHTAIVDGDGAYTYGELLTRARAAAAELGALGVRPGDAVLLTGHGGRSAVLGMLAVLFAGAHYVPVDPSFPAERTALMARLSGAVLQLSADERTPAVPGLTTRAVDELGRGEGRGEGQGEGRGEGHGRLPAPAAGPDDLAYVMFTSGTTGEPKPVGVTHRGVTGLALGAGPLRLGPEDGTLLHSTLAFDASTFEIWNALLAGARVVAVPRARLALHELAAQLARPEVTTAWLTAAVFHLMARHHPEALGTLRRLTVGGDVVLPDVADAFAAAHPGTTLLNGYGPTENTTFSTLGPVTGRDRAESATLPIGYAYPGTLCYVLDERLDAVTGDSSGELFVGGDRLARGYLDRPAATAERFLPDPFAATPGARMYRTGDRARLLPSGALEFLGRTDDEVKVRGFRVDLAEAQAVLAADPEVADVAVLAERTGEGATLLAFVTPAGLDTAALRERACLRVPRHLVAERILAVDALPLGPTGKVDREALRRLAEPTARPEQRTSDGPQTSPDPQTSPEPQVPAGLATAPEPALTTPLPALAELWQRHTGIVPGPDSDFFADGGSSLDLMRLVEDVRTGIGVELDFAEVYALESYGELAGLVEDLLGTEAAA
ncbi:amino acid adenylation domain-containing protein [Streptomyces sp. R44]|uniref:Amino acid adenylation domain-containing protein n=1 Tax=Streptomyces sp. R44 TaxID=3238633 RepID=A0AB39SZP1_9ACTN